MGLPVGIPPLHRRRGRLGQLFRTRAAHRRVSRLRVVGGGMMKPVRRRAALGVLLSAGLFAAGLIAWCIVRFHDEVPNLFLEADTDCDGGLSWRDLEKFQELVAGTFSYTENTRAWRPDEYLTAGKGDCEDFALFTGGWSGSGAGGPSSGSYVAEIAPSGTRCVWSTPGRSRRGTSCRWTTNMWGDSRTPSSRDGPSPRSWFPRRPTDSRCNFFSSP